MARVLGDAAFAGKLTFEDLVRFGGTTSSFPALKNSGATLQVRLADDSADAAISAASLTTTASSSMAGVTFTAATVLNDNVQFRFGTGLDYWFRYDTTQLELNSTDVDGVGGNGIVWYIADGTDDVVFNGDVQAAGQIYSPLTTTTTPTGTTATIDWDNGLSQVLDLGSATGDVTLTLSNPHAGASYVLKIIQDATTPRDVVWPGTVKHPDGVTPVISTGALAEDIATLWYDGTSYYVNIGPNYS